MSYQEEFAKVWPVSSVVDWPNGKSYQRYGVRFGGIPHVMAIGETVELAYKDAMTTNAFQKAAKNQRCSVCGK